MKQLRIMSIFVVSIACQSWAMEKPSAIQPISTMEWLFGYRTYTPDEQHKVDKLAKVEQEQPLYIHQWLREPFKGDTDTMLQNAEKIVDFIEIKYLQNTFPKVYKTAKSLITSLTDPEEIASLKMLEQHIRTKNPIVQPMSKTNIEKGLHPGISISKKISLK